MFKYPNQMFQINYVLKHTIREPRPALPHGQREDGKLWEKFGMPSSHSQFIWYFAVYVTLFLLVRLHHQVPFQSCWKALNKSTFFCSLNFIGPWDDSGNHLSVFLSRWFKTLIHWHSTYWLIPWWSLSGKVSWAGLEGPCVCLLSRPGCDYFLWQNLFALPHMATGETMEPPLYQQNKYIFYSRWVVIYKNGIKMVN